MSADALTTELLGRCSFAPPGTAAICGVSGGADSLALLALATAAGLDVTAVHVDHQLRSGSAADADVVAAAADHYGAAFRRETVSVAAGPNLEARARAARHAVLGGDALLGHTADDQAETVLLHLLRGAARGGLAGIAADGRRPLLRLRRAETEALCASEGLDPIVDPTNTDPTFRRNRVRSELIPLMNDIAARDVVGVITAQAEVLAAEDELLDRLAATLDPTDAAGLADADPALARRVVHRWLRSASVEGQPPDRAAVERVLAVARGERTATEVAGGARVARSEQRLRLKPGGSRPTAQQ